MLSMVVAPDFLAIGIELLNDISTLINEFVIFLGNVECHVNFLSIGVNTAIGLPVLFLHLQYHTQ